MRKRKKTKTLWEMVVGEVTVEDLSMIASADYGQDVDEHFRQLADIHRTGYIPGSLDWHPAEVMELTRWGDYKKYPTMEAQILFCSLTLLLSFHEGDEKLSINQDLGIIIDILSQRGKEWLQAFKVILDDILNP